MIFRQVPVHSSLLLGAAAMASQERKASRLTIRYGGDNGIMCYTFQLATRLNHNAWLTSLVQGTLTGQQHYYLLEQVHLWIYVPFHFCFPSLGYNTSLLSG